MNPVLVKKMFVSVTGVGVEMYEKEPYFAPCFLQLRKNRISLSILASINPVGEPFNLLVRTESTNNYAMAQAQAGLAQHGAAWFALEQWGGKGQRGKTWDSQPGENIVLSIVIAPQVLGNAPPFRLSAWVAMACHDLFTRHTDEDCRVKWPNDLYWRDRKAGGILIENSYRGSEWRFAIVGIGININQVRFPPEVLQAVSLKQITGKDFDPVALARGLCAFLQARLQAGFDQSWADYQQQLYKRGEIVRLKKGSRVFDALINYVADSGKLVTEVAGMEERFAVGEVEWVS
jgi:BirA family transcriptional regulator, biotin operon repressor / biotin---[acetyl-CoA-carboxylase] ligase